MLFGVYRRGSSMFLEKIHLMDNARNCSKKEMHHFLVQHIAQILEDDDVGEDDDMEMDSDYMSMSMNLNKIINQNSIGIVSKLSIENMFVMMLTKRIPFITIHGKYMDSTGLLNKLPMEQVLQYWTYLYCTKQASIDFVVIDSRYTVISNKLTLSRKEIESKYESQCLKWVKMIHQILNWLLMTQLKLRENTLYICSIADKQKLVLSKTNQMSKKSKHSVFVYNKATQMIQTVKCIK